MGWLVIFSLPFIIFVYHALRYSVNVPVIDDYTSVLSFLNSFVKAVSLRQEAGLIFAPVNEHRVLLLKGMILLDYWLEGKVSFRTLLLIGDIPYLLFTAAMMYVLYKRGLNKYQLIPIPYLLLSLITWMNMLHLTSQVFYWNALFALLMLIALPGRNIWLSCLLYPINIFTLGSGLVFYPLANGFLLIQKKWRELLLFFISSSVFTALYFFHLRSSPGSLRSGFLHFDQVINAFFAFLGMAFFPARTAVLIGIVFAILLIGIIVFQFKEDEFLPLLSLWIIGNALLVAAFRSGQGFGENYLTPRYYTFSLIAWVIVYVWGIEMINQIRQLAIHRFTSVFILIALFFYTFTLMNLTTGKLLEREKDTRITSLVALASSNNPEKYILHPNPSYALAVIETSRQLGVFDYVQTGHSLRYPVRTLNDIPVANSDFKGLIESNDGIHISGWAIIRGLSSEKSKIFVLLKDKQVIYQFETLGIERPDVSTSSYLYSGYEAYFAAYAIPPGSYDLGIMVQNGDRLAIDWQQVPLQINPITNEKRIDLTK
jgi:hypothetical protein